MFELVTAVVALLFGVWFGKAASRAGLNPFGWAVGGAALCAAVTMAVLTVGAMLLVRMAGDATPTTRFLSAAGLWVLGLILAIAAGSRILPKPAQEQLQIALAAQRARTQQTSGPSPADSLVCAKCSGVLAKRDAQLRGAIRIDDKTCICPDCKQQT